jgi:hypothetical protein
VDRRFAFTLTISLLVATNLAGDAGAIGALHIRARYKIYAAETHGFPVYFAVMTMPGSAQRRLDLAANEQPSWDLEELFHGRSVAGTSIDQDSQDLTAWEMSLPAEPRHRLHWPELTAYVVTALAIAVAVFYRMKP